MACCPVHAVCVWTSVSTALHNKQGCTSDNARLKLNYFCTFTQQGPGWMRALQCLFWNETSFHTNEKIGYSKVLFPYQMILVPLISNDALCKEKESGGGLKGLFSTFFAQFWFPVFCLLLKSLILFKYMCRGHVSSLSANCNHWYSGCSSVPLMFSLPLIISVLWFKG